MSCECIVNLHSGAIFTKSTSRPRSKVIGPRSFSTDVHGLCKLYEDTKYEHCISYDLRYRRTLTSRVDRVDDRVDIDGHTDK